MSVPRIQPLPVEVRHGVHGEGDSSTSTSFTKNGDAGAHRVIYMDGRPHPKPETLTATWWGTFGRPLGRRYARHRYHRLQRQVLVRRAGTPHSEKLHTIERWTRISYGTLVNDFHIDDPIRSDRQVQLRFVARIVKPGVELMEYICAENNQIGIAGGYLNKTDASPIGIGGGR
jgi:hypothetical protein